MFLKTNSSFNNIVLRLGSTTPLEKNNPKAIEINSIEGVQNSSSKLRMKRCFENANISHAKWYTFANRTNDGDYVFRSNNNKERDNNVSISNLPYPIIVKSFNGSRGRGNYKFDSVGQFKEWLQRNDPNNYIVEKYYSYLREYRLHVSQLSGCFYACRKMLKRDTPENKKFQRHDDNCVWIVEENPQFNKPNTWDNIISDCVKALKELKLDIAAFDVKVSKDGNYIIIESNSAPSFGAITLEKYKQEIEKYAKRK